MGRALKCSLHEHFRKRDGTIMAFRTFKITLPADTSNHNLFSLIVGTANYGLANGGTDETGITGAIPTDGILPDRGTNLEIQSDSGNANTLTVNDRNNANTTGKVLNKTDVFSVSSNRNTICFKDYLLKGGAVSQACEVRFETT
jgi:hypothetical protein